MDQFEYTYTAGLDREAIEAHLDAAETGVLSLADGGAAYAIPVAYHWDGESFVFRLGEHPDSDKMGYIESTTTASFLVYHYDASGASWSVLAIGTLRRLPAAEADRLEAREDFLPLRIFGEELEDLTPVLYALDVETLTGRGT